MTRSDMTNTAGQDSKSASTLTANAARTPALVGNKMMYHRGRAPHRVCGDRRAAFLSMSQQEGSRARFLGGPRPALCAGQITMSALLAAVSLCAGMASIDVWGAFAFISLCALLALCFVCLAICDWWNRIEEISPVLSVAIGVVALTSLIVVGACHAQKPLARPPSQVSGFNYQVSHPLPSK